MGIDKYEKKNIIYLGCHKLKLPEGCGNPTKSLRGRAEAISHWDCFVISFLAKTGFCDLTFELDPICMNIAENYNNIRKEVPGNVVIVVAAKTRTAQEIEEVIDAGATDIGENYVQEAESIYKNLPLEKAKKVRWHMIGPLQKNKINKALPIFNIIQTLDSFELAQAINKRAEKIIPVFVEVNIGGENTKSGIMAGKVPEFIESLSGMENIRIKGLMTIEPYSENPEDARPYFKKMKDLFRRAKELKLSNVDMKILSMGMSNSYKVAIEEGSNMVRIGTAVFGPRK